MAEARLTSEAIPAMLKGAKDMRPVLQLFDIKQVAGKMPAPDRERFRCSASDGEFVHQAMFAVQLNVLLKEEKVKNGSIVILTGYDIKDLQTRKIILILDLSVVKSDADIIGKPLKPLPLELTVSQIGMQVQTSQQQLNAQDNSSHSNSLNRGGMVPTPATDRFGSSGMGMPTVFKNERITPSRGLAPNPGEVVNAAHSDARGRDFHSNPLPKKHPGDFSEPPAKYSRTGPVSRNESAPRILPFKALSPYLGKWTIKGRVTAKSELKRYHNAKGEGKVFDFDLLDSESGEIRVTCFNKEAELFYDRIELGQVYMISKGQLKVPQRSFNHLNSDWEITLDSSSQVDACPDDGSIQKQHFNFCPIANIERMETNSVVDIVGIVISINPTSTLLRKNGTETMKRTCVVRDKSGRQIELTLWGTFCTKEGDQIQGLCDSGKSPIVAIKGGRISDFNGKGLGTISSSQLLVNPDITEALVLRRWFEMEGGKDQPSHSLSSEAAPSFSRRDTRKFIADIKDENIGKSGMADYIVTLATVSFIKHDNFYYQACPLMRDNRQCNKKVIDMGSGQFRCEACGSDLQDCDYRYLLSISVYDHTGVQWLIAFQDAAEELMGVPARDLCMLKEEDDPRFMEAFTRVRFSQHLLKLKVKEETWQDEQRIKCTVMKSEPANFASESKVLLDYIAKMKRGEPLSFPLDRSSGYGVGVSGLTSNESSYGYGQQSAGFRPSNEESGFMSSEKGGGFMQEGTAKYASSGMGSGYDRNSEARSLGGGRDGGNAYGGNPISSYSSRFGGYGSNEGAGGRRAADNEQSGYGHGYGGLDSRSGMGGGFINSLSSGRNGGGFSATNRSDVCYSCGKAGHFSSDCPSRGNGSARNGDGDGIDGRGKGSGFNNPSNSRGGGGGGFFTSGEGGKSCFRCGMDGHFARDCPSFNNAPTSGYRRQASGGMY